MHLDLVGAEKVSHFNLQMQKSLLSKELKICWESPDRTLNIKIGFIDNPFVSNYIESIEENINSRELNTTAVFSSPFECREDRHLIKKLTQELASAIEDLNLVTTEPFPIKVEELKFEPYDSYGRTVLNKIHRAFALCWLSNWKSWTSTNKSGPNLLIDPDSITPHFPNLLERVNNGVHELETFWYSSNFSDRFNVKDFNHEYNITFKDPTYRKLLPRDEIYRVTEGGYDVWVPMIHMTGKNYFSCYYDIDDPTMPDIIMENNLLGSIALGTREQLGTPAFLNWFKEYGMEPQYGIPLGYIVEGKKDYDILIKDFSNEFKVKNINF